MKNLLIFCFLIFSVSPVFSQDYMDKIVEKSCDCISKVPDSLTTEKRNMQLGLCLIEAAMPYSKQIKKEHKIDLEKLDTDGEKLGQIIALKMMAVCPNAVIKMAEGAMDDEEAPAPPPVVEGEVKTMQGTVAKIEDDNFVVFHVKDETGKVTKYYWMTFIQSNRDLINQYKALTGKTVKISYRTMEFFDPRIGEYRSFLVISSIDVVS